LEKTIPHRMNTQESTCDGEGTLNLHAPASTSISHSES